MKPGDRAHKRWKIGWAPDPDHRFRRDDGPTEEN